MSRDELQVVEPEAHPYLGIFFKKDTMTSHTGLAGVCTAGVWTEVSLEEDC